MPGLLPHRTAAPGGGRCRGMPRRSSAITRNASRRGTMESPVVYQVACSAGEREGRGTGAPSRRQALLASAATAVVVRQSAAVAGSGEVGGSGAFTSIGAAVAAAPEGAMIRIAPGIYGERLILVKRVVIVGDGGAAGTTLTWQSPRPYEAALEARGASGAAVRGLSIRHASPSVANNYAVFLQGSDLVLEDCDISSTTGSGIGIEGGAPAVRRCTVHDCERHGVAVFSELGGAEGGGSVQDCTIVRNKLDGILVREAAPAVIGNSVRQNGGAGATLKGCGGIYSGNNFASNGKGSIRLDTLADLDEAELARSNTVDRPVALQ